MVCEEEFCGFSEKLDSCGSTGAFTGNPGALPVALTVRDGSRVMERALLLAAESGDRSRSPLYSTVLQDRSCRRADGGKAGPLPLPLPPAKSAVLLFDSTVS